MSECYANLHPRYNVSLGVVCLFVCVCVVSVPNPKKSTVMTFEPNPLDVLLRYLRNLAELKTTCTTVGGVGGVVGVVLSSILVYFVSKTLFFFLQRVICSVSCHFLVG